MNFREGEKDRERKREEKRSVGDRKGNCLCDCWAWGNNKKKGMCNI